MQDMFYERLLYLPKTEDAVPEEYRDCVRKLEAEESAGRIHRGKEGALRVGGILRGVLGQARALLRAAVPQRRAG